jgi:hypothetical protein
VGDLDGVVRQCRRPLRHLRGYPGNKVIKYETIAKRSLADAKAFKEREALQSAARMR